MSLVHNGEILFGGITHSGIHAGPWEMPIHIAQFFMVAGEFHNIGQTKGRDLTCDVDAMGYATESGVASWVTAVQNLANLPLTGDLVVNYPSANSVTWASCTFLRIDERDEIKQDGTDGTYWQPLTFVWRQTR